MRGKNTIKITPATALHGRLTTSPDLPSKMQEQESNSELMWDGNKVCCTSKLCQEDQLSDQFTGKHQWLRDEKPDPVTGRYNRH